MGNSIRLALAPDSDLRAFTGAPRTLRAWLRYPRPIPDVSLRECWEDLDALLASVAGPGAGSPLRPQSADYTYPFAADHGAFALSSTRTQELLASLEGLTPDRVEAYVRERQEHRSAIAGGGSARSSEGEGIPDTEKLLHCLARLRECCALAVAKRYGLLMTRTEEPSVRQE
jgi:hypothetical protein